MQLSWHAGFRAVVLCMGWSMLLALAAAASARAADLGLVRLQLDDTLKPTVVKAIESTVNTARIEDEGDARQLYRRIRPLVRDVLGAQGYFSPEITLERDADGQVLQGRVGRDPYIVVKVVPGQPSKIASVDIQFEGELANPTPANVARQAELRDLWRLPVGQVFDQGQWDASKNAVLSNLLANNYAAATLAESLADVDPDTQQVYLQVVYDSGPAFTFGELQVEGLSKYPLDLVARYNNIKPGDPYEQERLLALLADLQATVYFASVDVKVKPDVRNPTLMPIVVKVEESKSKRVGLGGGYSSNTGFRSEASYTHNNLFDRAYSLVSGVRLDQKRQSAFTDVFLPPRQQGVMDSVGVSVDHQNVNSLEIQRSAVGVVRQFDLGRSEIKLGVNYQLEDRRVLDVNLGGTKALVASASWIHNEVNDRLNPSEGRVISGQVAVANSGLLSDQSFVRLLGKVQHYWTLTPQDWLSTRVELGHVFSDSARDIPQDYLFRAGGTNSLRGFSFLSVGINSQGVVQGGRQLAIGSVEYTRWLREPFGVAVFTDVGDVADSWSTLDLRAAVGAGVRYKTPAGPVALDIAKAQGESRPRIHFALGVAF